MNIQSGEAEWEVTGVGTDSVEVMVTLHGMAAFSEGQVLSIAGQMLMELSKSAAQKTKRSGFVS
jgi:hypothetical protein